MIEKIKQMKVAEKLRFCLTLVVCVASISGVLGLIFLLVNNIQYSNALVNNGFSQGEIGIFSTYLNKEPALIREMILLHDEAELQAAVAELDEIQLITNEAVQVMVAHCKTPAEQEYISIIAETLPEYRSIFANVEELAVTNQDEAATDLLLTQGKPTLKKLTDAVEGLIDLNVNVGNSVSARLQIQTYIIIGVMILVIIAAVLISSKFAKIIARLLSEPISQVHEASLQLVSGDLNITVEKMYPDEIGDMADSFRNAADTIKTYIDDLNRGLGEVANGNFNIAPEADFRGDFSALKDALQTIIVSLSDTLRKIHESSESVSLGATQMAESAQTLAEGATDQAASVEELTATIQNITNAVVNTSDKANKSHQDAMEFEIEAGKSNEDIRELTAAMRRINDTSKQIANIIAEIEDIASQTNLLSLNASIEAARAGEAGKGFAVVADQIGKLAADSATAAVNTRKLIENSIHEIEIGNEITEKTTSAIEVVINGIKTLAQSTREISDLSETQADSMKQLEMGVEQIAEVIQNNSAAAQQTSATSEELSAQATTLEELVNQFNLIP
ncbi:MAG: MCP four helix bundle domain-containing protein [Lachnospiraceae bacterium]|nr:MCP four helix bundle domain-containing protein [Lachnospiraceae bacterium]